MLQKLPSEILLEVCRYLSVRDIVQLQRTNSSLHCFVKQNEHHIVTDKFQTDFGANKNYMYGTLTYIITEQYRKVSGHLLWQLYQTNKTFPIKEIRWIVLKHINWIRVSNNELINYVYRKVFYWYYSTPHVVSNGMFVSLYPNKLELYMLYRFLLINAFRTVDYVDSNISFIDTFIYDSPRLFQIGAEYFKHVIENKIDVRFDSLHKMSKTVVTLPIIKRLFGCRQLNLDHSLLISCCEECNSDALEEILNFKTNRPDDYFLSKNYKTIKAFLIRINIGLYRELANLENKFINARIFYRHPSTRRRVRLDSKVSCRLLYQYNYEHSFAWNDRVYHEYTSLQRHICRRKSQLFSQYFM